MFGEILRKERKAKKKSLREMSKDLEISFSALGKYERGENEPDISTLIKLSNYFDVSVDYMLGLSNIKNINSVQMLSHDRELFDNMRVLNPDEQKVVLEIVNSINLLFEPYLHMGQAFDKDILGLYSDLLDRLWRFNSIINEEYIHDKRAHKNSDTKLKDDIKLLYFKYKSEIDEVFLKLLDSYITKAID